MVSPASTTPLSYAIPRAISCVRNVPFTQTHDHVRTLSPKVVDHMEFYVKLSIERLDGPAQALEAVRDALEAEIDRTYLAAQDSRHRTDSSYIVSITGIEITVAGLMASIKARAVQEAQLRKADRELEYKT